MSDSVLYIGIFIVYFSALIGISFLVNKKTSASGYLTGNYDSIWWLITLGLVGDSLSGVTYLSVPAATIKTSAYYFQVVLGFFLGYWIIAFVFLPRFYRQNFISIYGYLGERLGKEAQRCGAIIFLISRSFGAATRLYLSILALHRIVFHSWIPFEGAVIIATSLIFLYTVRGGIKTLVWTDAFQSLFLILGVLSVLYFLWDSSLLSAGEIWSNVRILDTDIFSKSFWGKQFFGGIAIALTMTGLDQNLMQKNLSCRTLAEAKLNLLHFSWLMLFVTAIILIQGIYLADFLLLHPIASSIKTDLILPTVVMGYCSLSIKILFLLGLLAASFSSADSVLPTLTTSFHFDILERPMTKKSKNSIHGFFAVLLLVGILLLHRYSTSAMIEIILLIASYTYGPMLGLFAFAYTHKSEMPKGSIVISCSLAPLLTYIIVTIFEKYTLYHFGQEILLINSAITYVLLYMRYKEGFEEIKMERVNESFIK